MTKPTRHQKKRRIYTHWDKRTTEVKIVPKTEQTKEEPTNKVPLQVEVDKKNSAGVYSNFAGVSFNIDNFIIDFVALASDKPKGKLVSRIISSPRRIKQILVTLENSIRKYEEKFGAIKI